MIRLNEKQDVGNTFSYLVKIQLATSI